MSLTADTDGVKASVTARIGSVEAEVGAKLDGVKAGVTGRLTPTMQFVPLRLGGFQQTDGFLAGGMTYVDDGENSYKLPLSEIKRMNTKIVIAETSDSVDKSKLEVGDFIYEIGE